MQNKSDIKKDKMLNYSLKKYFEKMVPLNEEEISKKFDEFQIKEKPYQSKAKVLTDEEIQKWRNYKRSNLYEEYSYKFKATDKFINASNMTATGSDRPYIATQSPIPVTFSDFWQMIFETKAALIVDLAQLGDLKQSEQYWPDNTVHSITYTNGFSVTFENQIDIIPNKLVERQFIIKKEDEEMKVSHLHYSGWPDMGIPDETSFIELIEINALKNIENRPTVVHCSSGIGRTGTFLSISHLVSLENKELNACGDYVLDTIKEFRKQRRGMVETSGQFIMIHNFFLKRYGFI